METSALPRPASQAFLGTAPAGRWDLRLATIFIVLSFAGLIVIAPFARLDLAPLPAFVPAYESALWICDLIAAVLLLGQFHRSQSPSILVLSSGYLMSSFIIVPHIMAFPGVFASKGLLGGNGQTIGWLYVFWHTSFPLFVLAHSLTAKAEAAKGWRWTRPGLAIAAAVVLLLAWVALATALATHPAGLLPVISINGNYSSMVTSGVSPVMIAVTLAALIVLWRNSRGTVLDVWLMVVMSAWVCDIVLSSIVSDTRFDLGWYAGRVFALASGAFLLGVLLLDLGRLYGSLADALEEAHAHNEALVRSREELMRAQRLEAVGKLTGGIAHDFNNMLTAIIGYLDMICRHPTDAARVVQMARHASNAADRGAQLIKQLLTFARKQNLRPQVLNPNDLLQELRSLAQKALNESVDLSLDLAEDLDCVCVDAAEFQACILNLVGNARDAMPGGGTLRISTRNVAFDIPSEARGIQPGRYVLLAVSDTGHGMDEATLAHVFEPFFTTKDIGKGTGLGLSQVHGFAHSAQGFVEIASAPEEGTTVSVYLPRSLAPAAAESVRAPPRFDARKKRVLVVEDDPDVMNTTAECLRDCGFEVLTAVNGDEALAILHSARRVDILFSDIAMPGSLSGVQLARQGLAIWPKLKVLLTSGYAGTLLEDRGFAEDWPLLSKPYHRDDLLRLLETLTGDTERLPSGG
jgi:signal transduction histidine kinase/ActR/RegA family two-component response regulator